MSNKIKCSHILVEKHSQALQLLDEIKKGKTGTAPIPDYSNTKPNTYHDYDLGGDKIPVYEPTNKEGGDK